MYSWLLALAFTTFATVPTTTSQAQDAACDPTLIPCPITGCSEDVRAYDQSILRTSVFRKDAVEVLSPLAYPIQGVNFTTYTAWADGKVGQTVALSREMWFTVEPELQLMCRRYAAGELVPRLHKLLGLKPATADEVQRRRFVLFTIEEEQTNGPAKIGPFRPCADPNPKATECGNATAGADDYKRWFGAKMAESYKLDANMTDTGYPWTRLGYTYDWDTKAPSHRGAQEYVAPEGTRIRIRAIVNPADYCRASAEGQNAPQ